CNISRGTQYLDNQHFMIFTGFEPFPCLLLCDFVCGSRLRLLNYSENTLMINLNETCTETNYSLTAFIQINYNRDKELIILMETDIMFIKL
ncbi:hypothetical protein ACJX0J_007529, partial [Zea mays]